MDEDHARLEQAIEQAAEAPEAELPALHADLARELAAHFAREEDLMRVHDFPGLHCHMAQHRLIVEEARRPVAGGAISPAGAVSLSPAAPPSPAAGVVAAPARPARWLTEAWLARVVVRHVRPVAGS